MKAASKSSKRVVTFEKEAGGAIRHAKRKEPVTSGVVTLQKHGEKNLPLSAQN